MSAIRRQDGLTLVEVIVAMLVLVGGALAVLQVVDVSARNAYRAEQGQVAINVAQREMERIRQLDYADVALTGAPGAPSGSNDPRQRVAGSTFKLKPTDATGADLVVKGQPGQATGLVSPGPTPFELGDVSGEIYRFVVWRDDPGCIATCPGTKDFKRVVVAVKLDNEPISHDRPYQEVHSDFTDPESSLTSGGGSGGGALITAQQFFLSDTPCSTGDPARVDITANHNTHDTLGTCANTSTQKPDALLTQQAPDPAPENPDNPPLYDYADDVESEALPNPNNDRGLQMLRPNSNGCNDSLTETDSKKKVHRWVSRPLSANFVMTGSATLELFTRTIDDVNIPGAICIYLLKRAPGALGADLRIPIPLTSISAVVGDPFGYSCSLVGTPAVGKCQTTIWPRNEWGRARFNVNFAPNTTLLPGERLELALSVERAGTPANALQFMYDHPDYSSRLEVKTLTPLG